MKRLLLLLIFIIVLSSVKADFLPYDDISGKNRWEIYNFTNITANDYLCVAGTCYNSFAGSGTVTSVDTDNIYLTGGEITASGTISFNETLLNSTIDARTSTISWASVTSKPFNSVDSNDYLTIVSGVLGYNESLLNNTIDARGGSSYDNESPISLVGTTFGLSACPDTQIYAYNTSFGGWQCQPKTSGVGGGTVTSVTAGTGMDFSPITSSGSVNANISYFNVRFNETNKINAVNSSLQSLITKQSNDNTTQAGLINTKLDTTDQRYNETSKINYTKSLAFSGTTTKTLTLTMLTGTLSNTFTDIDTTYSVGNGISLSGTTFSVAGNTALTQDSDGLSVTNDAIGDTQLTFNTGQHLTTTSDVQHNSALLGYLNLSTSTFNNYFCTNSTGFKWLGTNDYNDCLQ